MVAHRQRLVLWVLAAGVAGGCGMLLPGQVYAACGDYLMTRHSTPASHTTESDRSTTQENHEQTPAPSPQRPCSGPRCGSSIPPVLPPLPVRDRMVTDTSAILTHLAAWEPDLASRGHFDVFGEEPQSSVSSIFHPPR